MEESKEKIAEDVAKELKKADKPWMSIYKGAPFLVEKYRALLKGHTSSLVTQSMIFAYQKGLNDAIKLLQKEEVANEKNAKKS